MSKGEWTAAEPVDQYYVETDAGRFLCWSASSIDDLFRQLTERGHRAKRVLLMTEREAELMKIEGQQELNQEHNEMGGAA